MPEPTTMLNGVNCFCSHETRDWRADAELLRAPMMLAVSRDSATRIRLRPRR